MTFVLLLCVITYFRNQSKRAHNSILKPQSFQVLKIEDQVVQHSSDCHLTKIQAWTGLGHDEFIIYLGGCINVNEIIIHILYEKSYIPS